MNQILMQIFAKSNIPKHIITSKGQSECLIVSYIEENSE